MDWLYFQFCKVQFLCYQGEPNWLGWLIVAAPLLFVALNVAWKRGWLEILYNICEGLLELLMVGPIVIVKVLYESIGDLIKGVPELYRAAFISADRYAERKFEGSLRKAAGLALKVFHLTWITFGLSLGAVGFLYLIREWYLTGQFPYP